MPTYYVSRIVSNFAASLFPAYASYKAIKTKNIKEVVPWLMYWIVLALFNVVESLADMLVFWLPFYYEMKLVFILWLILPQTRGHIIIYRYFVHPTLKTHEQKIDEALTEAHSKAMATSAQLGKKVFTAIQHYAIDSLLDGRYRSFSAPAVPPKIEELDKQSTTPKPERRVESAELPIEVIPNKKPRPPRKDSKKQQNEWKTPIFKRITRQTSSKTLSDAEVEEMVKNITQKDYLE